jgi:hypothetical protein
MDPFRRAFAKRDLAALSRLESPVCIQAFLDSIPYSADPVYRSPRSILRDRKAHCFDGALFAAAALRRLGYPPLILDMFAENDDEHCIALFGQNGRWGAVAKSNFVGLRFREAVYRSLRELVMSYFDDFYNTAREKTLRSYTIPLDLSRFDDLNWMGSGDHLEVIAERTDRIRRVPVITGEMAAALSPVDQRSYEAGLLGVNWAGLYTPDKKGQTRGKATGRSVKKSPRPEKR